MSGDDFQRLDPNALSRLTRRRTDPRRSGLTVLQEQQARADRAASAGNAACIVPGEVDGAPGWTLHGSPVRAGAVLEVYTNKANGWIRGQVAWSGDPSERPRLHFTLWDPHGRRDVDGLPPRVGRFEAEIPEGARCRWSAAMPEEID